MLSTVTFYLLVAASLLTNCGLGAAQGSNRPFGDENFGNTKIGPWGVNNTSFSELLDSQPNATGQYPFDGPELDAQAPGTGSVSGWAWDIKVRADLPINSSYYSDTSEFRGNVFTGAQLTLLSPNITPTTNSSWLICLIYWDLDESYSDELRQDDGTCSSVLSDSCRSDMAGAVAKRWETSTGFDRCQCPDLTAISSCGNPPVAFRQNCGANPYNATFINNPTFVEKPDASGPFDWTNGRLLLRTYGGEASPKGNISAYNQTGSLAWPFMLAWGSQAVGLESNVTSQLTCIRATNATSGSIVPGRNSTASGGSEYRSLKARELSTAIAAAMIAVIWMSFV